MVRPTCVGDLIPRRHRRDRCMKLPSDEVIVRVHGSPNRRVDSASSASTPRKEVGSVVDTKKEKDRKKDPILKKKVDREKDKERK